MARNPPTVGVAEQKNVLAERVAERERSWIRARGWRVGLLEFELEQVGR